MEKAVVTPTSRMGGFLRSRLHLQRMSPGGQTREVGRQGKGEGGGQSSKAAAASAKAAEAAEAVVAIYRISAEPLSRLLAGNCAACLDSAAASAGAGAPPLPTRGSDITLGLGGDVVGSVMVPPRPGKGGGACVAMLRLEKLGASRAPGSALHTACGAWRASAYIPEWVSFTKKSFLAPASAALKIPPHPLNTHTSMASMKLQLDGPP